MDEILEGIRAGLDKAGFVVVPRGLLDSLVSEEDCDLDAAGGCRAHAHLGFTGWMTCPQAEIRKWLDDWD